VATGEVKAAEREEWLRQEWVHSHEEDTDGARVFRPASFPFPPSRGRRAIDLRRADVLVQTGPGPADRPETVPGRWRVAGDTLTLMKDGAPDETLDIVAISANRLLLRTGRV
jgi:hypothetical protein